MDVLVDRIELSIYKSIDVTSSAIGSSIRRRTYMYDRKPLNFVDHLVPFVEDYSRENR